MSRTRPMVATVLTLLLAAPLSAAAGQESPSPSAAPSAAPNAAPEARPDAASVTAGSSVSIPVLDNDSDDGATCPDAGQSCLHVVAVTGSDRATHDGSAVTFTSRAGDEGEHRFTYEVSDGELTDTAEVVITVTDPATRTVSITMPSRPVALRTYAVAGKVVPAAGKVTVALQRRTPNGWTLVRRDRTDPQGRYSIGYRTDRIGTQTFRAVATWPSGPVARSASLRRTFDAVADASVSGPLRASDVPHSWRPGCPVPPSSLRRIRINRIDYSGRVARGSIIVRAAETSDVVRVLTAALNQRFPIRAMRPSDRYYAGGRRTPMESDKASMRAGNTSAFNCRPVVGNPYRMSQHSYGNAVDINTIENPYVTSSQVYPPGSREYLKRSPYRRGMILRDGVIASRMRALGWLWGARWSRPDYQHFSSNGG